MKLKYKVKSRAGKWGLRLGAVVVVGVLIASLSQVFVKPPKASAAIALLGQTNGLQANGTTVTANKPAGTVTGSVMIAQLLFDSNRTTTTVTVPTGWTRIGSQINTNNRYQNIYYKVATAAEPASYTWTMSRTVNALVGISSYSGVNTTAPIDASSNQVNTGNSNNPPAPSVNTTNTDELILVLWGYGAQTTASAYSGGLTALQTTSTTNVGIGQAYLIKNPIGATGTFTSTIGSLGGATSTVHTLALKPASAPAGIVFVAATTPVSSTSTSSLSIAYPTGWKGGDLLITNVSWDNNVATLNTPSGWTQIDSTQLAGGSGGIASADFYRFVQSGDTPSTTWTFSGTTTGAVISNADFSGVDPDPLVAIDATAQAIDAASTSHNAPSVTTNYSSDLLLDIWTYGGGLLASTHTTSLTQAWSARDGTNTTNNVGTWSGYETIANAGATGTRNTTISNSRVAVMHSIALKPYIPTPELDYPADGDSDIPRSPTFMLKNVSLTASPLQYKIVICSDVNCTNVLYTYDETLSQTGWSGQDANSGTAYTAGTTLDGSTEANLTPTTPLAAGTTYYWRARSYDTSSGSFSLFSNSNAFTTSFVPAAPSLYSPPSTGASLSPEFQLSTTDADSDNVEYKIDICTNGSCSVILHTITQTLSQTGWSGQDDPTATMYATDPTSASNSTTAYYDYQFNDLAPNTQYWWRAYAIDPGGSNTYSAASAITSFVTNQTEVRILSGSLLNGTIR